MKAKMCEKSNLTRQKDHFIFGLGLLNCLIAPWIPIDRIVCMLQEIWRFFIDQSVGMHWFASRCIQSLVLLKLLFVR